MDSRTVTTLENGDEVVCVSQTHYALTRNGQGLAHAKFFFASQKWLVYRQNHPSTTKFYISLRAAVQAMKEIAA